MKVPAIFRHRGIIPAGVVTDTMVSQYDFLPRIVDCAGERDLIIGPVRV